MPALIKDIIQKQNFEHVNERIGAIAKLELEAQKVKQGFEEPVNVFSERLDPFQDAENMMVNTMFDSLRNPENAQGASNYTANYFVDVYATGASTDTERGDLRSNKKLLHFLGMLRSIFSNTVYRTLGFERGVIGRVSVSNIQIAQLENKTTGNINMGRLTLEVGLMEDQPLQTGVLMSDALTGVKLDLTEQGYKYEKL